MISFVGTMIFVIVKTTPVIIRILTGLNKYGDYIEGCLNCKEVTKKCNV